MGRQLDATVTNYAKTPTLTNSHNQQNTPNWGTGESSGLRAANTATV